MILATRLRAPGLAALGLLVAGGCASPASGPSPDAPLRRAESPVSQTDLQEAGRILNPSLAAGLRQDPGSTAAGTIDGLITFQDLSLLGEDIDDLLDYIYKPSSERAQNFTFSDKITRHAGPDKAVVGYMIALEFQPKTDKVISFMLVRDLMECCFGGIPRPDEWLLVDMPKGVDYRNHMYVPVTVRGEFKPGRVEDEEGYAAAIYSMTAESVTLYEMPESR